MNVLADIRGTKPLVIALVVLLTLGAVLILRKIGGTPVVFARKIPFLGEVFALAIFVLPALFSGKGVL